MNLRNFGPGLSNSYRASLSSLEAFVLFQNLFPSFECWNVFLFEGYSRLRTRRLLVLSVDTSVDAPVA